jgi:hypothetical protein
MRARPVIIAFALGLVLSPAAAQQAQQAAG